MSGRAHSASSRATSRLRGSSTHIRKEVEASLDDLALEMLWSSGPGIEPVIEIGVVADIGGKGQAALDRRYGPGLVHVVPTLKPVS